MSLRLQIANLQANKCTLWVGYNNNNCTQQDVYATSHRNHTVVVLKAFIHSGPFTGWIPGVEA